MKKRTATNVLFGVTIYFLFETIYFQINKQYNQVLFYLFVLSVMILISYINSLRKD